MTSATQLSAEAMFAEARAIADAVLYEGYVLYPYRASARKNQLRWQFGVLYPAAFAAASSERAAASAEFLLDVQDAREIHLRARFLHVQHRSVFDPNGVPVPALLVDDVPLPEWDEAVAVDIDLTVPVDAGTTTHPARVSAYTSAEPVVDAAGTSVGSIERTRRELRGAVTVVTAEVATGVLRIRVELRNHDHRAPASREDALATSFVGAHVIAAAPGGRFVSTVDPPPELHGAAALCTSDGLWPVLVGTPPAQCVLAAPIILYDDARIAPESPGELYDGLEIDEILSLRTLALTDEEKAEARATDPRAAAVIDRVDDMPAEIFDRLHGAIRRLTPVDAADDKVQVGGRRIGRGDQVVLRPGSRRADAQDLFLAGRSATVQEVHVDLDGRRYLAVTVDGDPATELHLAHGRFLYFDPDEVELP